MNRQELARRGEAEAARYLAARGMAVIERNYRCRLGEIDLVARDGQTLVIVEVRTRSTSACGRPEESVDWRKRRRLRRLAAHYLSENRGPYPYCRIDLVAVEVNRATGRLEAIRHYRGIAGE